ncbi:MAG: hydroxyacid dehydrogenase [Rickettsiales bacterium]|jgi:FAD/FMN-containing dehydrogenase|nr:hydroxyacid dehydrogenase [Rickettsiales bacterium]
MRDPYQAIQELLGPKACFTDAQDKAPFETPWRGGAAGKAALVCFPESTAQVAALVKLCTESRIPIVPQGGNTGLVRGSTPDDSGKEVVINLSRMKAIRAFDPIARSVTVEAGCVLASLKEQVEAKGLLFPLGMASEGSAEIGGCISTNAGGTAVLRYGNMRELVAGLEVVLPNGEIFNCLQALKKDNTGYDLKQLFMGAEGTLGIITAATLKLFPLPTSTETAFLQLANLQASLPLLSLFQEKSSGTLTAFELLPSLGIQLTEKHIPGVKNPLAGLGKGDYAVLVELSGDDAGALRLRLEGMLEVGLQKGWITDGVIAENGNKRKGLWQIRENLSEAQKKEGATINFDVTVPIASVPVFIEEGLAAIAKLVPGIRAVPFGHLGDGNIHFNLLQPEALTPEEFLAKKGDVKDKVYGIVHCYNGSISAEHGVGMERRNELLKYKSPVALSLMRSIKKSIDPHLIMNPGRVFEV